MMAKKGAAGGVDGELDVPRRTRTAGRLDEEAVSPPKRRRRNSPTPTAAVSADQSPMEIAADRLASERDIQTDRQTQTEHYQTEI